jgi:hypothetical protein
MTEEQLFMSNPTHRMLSDTVMRYRQLQASLAAITILDWEKMQGLAFSKEPGQIHCSEWDDLFDSHKLGRYANWFEENFGSHPALLRQLAINSVRNLLGYQRPARQMTLQEILVARYRSDLQIYFWPARGEGFVERETHSSIRLRLYDSRAGNWEWQKAVFGPAAPQQVDVEMTPVPTTLAEIVHYSAKGSAIKMNNRDDLLVEPIIETLPFPDVTIPSSYFQID